MANLYVNGGDGATTGYYAVTKWAAGTAYVIGDIRRQLAAPSVGNERCFRCTTAGTSGGAEPAWTITKGGTTADNTVTWTEITGNETYQTAGAWAAPHARLKPAMSSLFAVAGDNVFVASNHAETQAAAMTLTSVGTAASPINIYCVDESGTGHVPPTSVDLKTTATVTTTGAFGITMNTGWAYCNGISFNSGTGASASAALSVANSSGGWTLENCALNIKNTNAASSLKCGSTAVNNPTAVTLKNTTVQFSATGQTVSVLLCLFKWLGGSVTGATIPTVFFSDSGTVISSSVYLEGVDLTSLTSSTTIVQAQTTGNFATFKDCKFASGAVLSGAQSNLGCGFVQSLRSDNAGTNYRNEKYIYNGSQKTEVAIIRTGGASDGTTGISWNLTTTANSKWAWPLEAFPIVIWNPTTASNVTATIEGVWNAAALPNNDDFWFDMEYLGSATSPLGSTKTGTKAAGMDAGTALTASTQAWDSQVTARANTTAYTLGQVYKSANNAGRIFFCTTAGTSAGSEPAGIATAVDGGIVTDGTAIFRAAVRFKLTVTMTSPQPAQIGAVYAYCKAAKASSTFYIDPKITLA